MAIKRARILASLLGAAVLTSGVLAGCTLSTPSANATPPSVSTTAPASAAASPGGVASGAPGAASGSGSVSVVAPAQGSGPVGVAVAAPASAASAARSPVIVQAAPDAATTSGTPQANSITVSGTGQIQAQPDEAFVSAGVQTRAQTAQDAQTTNNRQMQAVIDAVKALGIPAKDIQTSGVSLSPVYGTNETLQGYEARNTINVTVEQINQAGQVLDTAVKAGANQTGGISFGLKNDTALRNKALAAAVADARSKADALAGAASLKISGIQAISESSVNVPIPVARAPLGAAASPQAVPVEPGQLTVTAQVTVVYGY